MLKILSGKIEFYSKWKVERETRIRAPNLKQTENSLSSNLKQEIMDELSVPSEVQKDLKEMVEFIGINNTPEEKA